MAPKNEKVDIHNWKAMLDSTLALVKDDKTLSARNKELIFKYDEDIQIKEPVGVPRRIKILRILRIIANRYFKKDYDKVTKVDLERALLQMEKICKASTRTDYKAILKKFLKWIEWGDKSFRDRKNCPEWLQIIRTSMTVKEQEETKLTKSDLLTPEEVLKLIQTADHTRDKAILSVMYDLGARVGEIGNLRIKDVNKEQHGFYIDLSGKTGRRTPIAIMCAPYLTQWLNTHPQKDNPNAPLWIQRNSHTNNLPNASKVREMKREGEYVLKPMTYAGILKMVHKTVEKAGIKKHVHPHLFRHSRVTHLLGDGTLTDAQAKQYFGWKAHSKVLGQVYSHLTDQDANNAILADLGLKPQKTHTDKLKSRVCLQCETLNAPDFRFCGKCGMFLDTSTAIEYQEKKKAMDNELYATMENLLADPEGRKIFMKHMSKDLMKQLGTK